MDTKWLVRSVIFVPMVFIVLFGMYWDSHRDERYDRKRAEQQEWLAENQCRKIGYENSRWISRTLFVCKDGKEHLILVMGPRIIYVQ